MATNSIRQGTIALVAGGAGFIGSHLCKALLKQQKHVICIDNLQTGHMQNIKDIMNSSAISKYINEMYSSGYDWHWMEYFSILNLK
jgi:UDP-glucose 4-epimerase